MAGHERDNSGIYNTASLGNNHGKMEIMVEVRRQRDVKETLYVKDI